MGGVVLVSRLAVFLDDGGVMNDNTLRGAQWRLAGEFFAPILGGTPGAWSEANRAVTTRILEPAAWMARLRAAPNYDAFDRAYQVEWLHEMCRLVGAPPPSEDESLALARRADAFVIPRIRAAFPGAVEAIRTLHEAGYALHTASGASSTDLAGYLDGMGVRACFDRLYGPDLIDTFKAGPAYYERLLADAGIAPSEALIVDDSPLAANWAMQAGARVVLVGAAADADVAATAHIRALAELPQALQRLG
jgi:HAD superfamily hydrolase (TIGR01509 family)